jgi:hypothetical protein
MINNNNNLQDLAHESGCRERVPSKRKEVIVKGDTFLQRQYLTVVMIFIYDILHEG